MTHRVRPWMLSGLLICALLAGCATSPPTASTPPSSTLATATSTATATATPTPRPTTLYLAAGETVYALDLTTGAKRWTYATGLPAQSGGRNNWISAIAATSGVVYFDSVPDNSLYALKTSDGSLLWKASIPPTATNYIFVTPRAIITASLFHQQPTSVAALDPQSGKTLWTQPDTGPNALLVGSGVIYESYDASGSNYGKSGIVQAVNAATAAVVWQAAGHNYFDLALTNNLLYASGDDALHAFDARTGKEVWSQSFNDATAASQPRGGAYYVHVTQGDSSTLYLANGATVYALNGATHSVIWHVALNGGVIGPMTSGVLCAASSQTVEGLDPATGAVKWQMPVLDGYTESADGGICYYQGIPATISALDAQTGATRWTYNDGDNTARLTAYNGVLYVLAKVSTGGVDNDPVLHALAGSNGSTQWTLDTHALMPGVMTVG